MIHHPTQTSGHDSSAIRQAGFVISVMLLAIWQVALFQYTLKWDAMDITLPWRYFVADAIYQNGTMPWWNPFQHQGFAQGLSLETWYPIAHFVSLFKPYDLYSLNIEYILHLLIASYGFYRLARSLGITHQGGLWGALVFPLTGFFLSNSQHTGWIAAGAWFPHLLASFIHWLKDQNLPNSLGLLLISFLMVSGGYIAYTIISAYVLFFLWFRHLAGLWRNKENTSRFIWYSARTAFALTITLSLLIVAMWMLKDQIDRGSGLEGEALLKGSLYFKHLVTLVAPFSTLKGTFDFWHGDQALVNIYVSIPALILLIISIRKIDQSFYRFWWIIVLLSLSLALAVELPLRKWFNVLPLFNLFRLPSLFRYYTILAMVLIAAKMIGDHPYPNIDTSRFRRLFLKISSLFLVLIIACAIILIIRRPEALFHLLKLEIGSISEAMIFQLAIHSFLMIGFLVGAWLLRKRLAFYKLLLLYTAIDLILAFQLNIHTSVLSEAPLSQMQPCIEQMPQGYPAPSPWDVLGSNDDQSLQVGAIYRNTNTFFKRIGWNGYTPFQYQKYIEFEKTPFFNKALGLPAIFLTQSLTHSDSVGCFISVPLLNPTDEQLAIKNFTPNSITAVVYTALPYGLVYNQNFAKGWKATVDGHHTQLLPVDHSLMGLRLSPGTHEVTFYYDPGNLFNVFWISFTSLLIIALFYIWFNRKRLVIWVILSGLGISLLAHGVRKIMAPVTTALEVPSGSVINRIDEIKIKSAGQIHIDRFLDKGDLNRFEQSMINLPSTLNWYDREICNTQRHFFNDFLEKNFHLEKSALDNGYMHTSGLKHEDSLVFLMQHRFEAPVNNWFDQNVSIKYENDNLFQSLKNRRYSATFKLDLQTIQWSEVAKIQISLDYRNSGPMETSLIFALQDQNEQDIVWKSQELSSHEGSWKKQVWTQDRQPVWDEARYLGVYIWNAGQSDVEIDNVHLAMSRRSIEH